VTIRNCDRCDLSSCFSGTQKFFAAHMVPSNRLFANHQMARGVRLFNLRKSRDEILIMEIMFHYHSARPRRPHISHGRHRSGLGSTGIDVETLAALQLRRSCVNYYGG
jgi:hypothetical protein